MPNVFHDDNSVFIDTRTRPGSSKNTKKKTKKTKTCIKIEKLSTNTAESDNFIRFSPPPIRKKSSSDSLTKDELAQALRLILKKNDGLNNSLDKSFEDEEDVRNSTVLDSPTNEMRLKLLSPRENSKKKPTKAIALQQFTESNESSTKESVRVRFYLDGVSSMKHHQIFCTAESIQTAIFKLNRCHEHRHHTFKDKFLKNISRRALNTSFPNRNKHTRLDTNTAATVWVHWTHFIPQIILEKKEESDLELALQKEQLQEHLLNEFFERHKDFFESGRVSKFLKKTPLSNPTANSFDCGSEEFPKKRVLISLKERTASNDSLTEDEEDIPKLNFFWEMNLLTAKCNILVPVTSPNFKNITESNVVEDLTEWSLKTVKSPKKYTFGLFSNNNTTKSTPDDEECVSPKKSESSKKKWFPQVVTSAEVLNQTQINLKFKKKPSIRKGFSRRGSTPSPKKTVVIKLERINDKQDNYEPPLTSSKSSQNIGGIFKNKKTSPKKILESSTKTKPTTTFLPKFGRVRSSTISSGGYESFNKEPTIGAAPLSPISESMASAVKKRFNCFHCAKLACSRDGGENMLQVVVSSQWSSL